MSFVNKVEISGLISDIRVAESGTHFITLKQQDTNKEGLVIHRNYELFVNVSSQDIISRLMNGKRVRFIGELTNFKLKKYGIYKMIIKVNQMFDE